MWKNILDLLLLCPALAIALPFHYRQSVHTKQHKFVCQSELEGELKAWEEFLTPNRLALRSFLLNPDRQWAHAKIPYEIDCSFSQNQVAKIKYAMKMFSDASCVKWIPRQNQIDYVRFTYNRNKAVCNSRVGRRGGRQDITLGYYCFTDYYRGAIPHEMMHAIGFIHEQQRLDRDCYVKVAVGSRGDFVIVANTNTAFPYDFGSIMHYGEGDEMTPIYKDKLGNSKGTFTELDKMKLNNMYCGGPTFCQLRPKECVAFRKAQKKCRSLLAILN